MKPPDFLCIGGHICGTTWLHKQLGKHPEIWASPVKELHYWDRLIHDGAQSKRYAKHRRQARKCILRQMLHLSCPKARADIQWAWRFLTQDRRRNFNRDWYCSLFPDGFVVGETTPAYELLDEAEIAQVASVCPNTKILYILRNPIERAWSLACKQVMNSRTDLGGRELGPAIADHLMNNMHPQSPAVERARYTQHIDRWLRYYRQDQLCVLFFDEMREAPETFFKRIEQFFGIEEGVLPIYNTKTTKTRKKHGSGQDYPMPDEVRRHLSGVYRDEIHELARCYGAYAEKWKEQLA